MSMLSINVIRERIDLVSELSGEAITTLQGRTVAAIFEAQAKRRPDAVAVSFEHEQLTYCQLNAQANRYARSIAKEGITRGMLVGLCMERSPRMVAALLAIIKAGGAYVPLDPRYPQDRLRFIVEDAQAPWS